MNKIRDNITDRLLKKKVNASQETGVSIDTYSVIARQVRRSTLIRMINKEGNGFIDVTQSNNNCNTLIIMHIY